MPELTDREIGPTADQLDQLLAESTPDMTPALACLDRIQEAAARMGETLSKSPGETFSRIDSLRVKEALESIVLTCAERRQEIVKGAKS